MSYPNPLTVRTVKAYLKDAAADAGMLGASAVVQGIMGSAWGWLFNRSNNREYLNFIGELASRTVSPNVQKIATQVYQNNHVTYKDGKYKVEVPALYNGNFLFNDDGTFRSNGHTYDTVDYGSDMSKKFRHNFTNGEFKTRSEGEKKQINVNIQNNNKNQNNKQNDNKNKKKNHYDKNKIKVQHFSDTLLLDTINAMCSEARDFSSADFSIATVFQALKTKITNLFVGKSKDESAKAVLQGCYEYLVENGYDAYPLMVEMITANSSSDFSESVEKNDTVTLEDLKMFRNCATLYSRLNDDQKVVLKGFLESECGSTPTAEYLLSLGKYSETGVPPKESSMKVFKVLTIISICLSTLRVLLSADSLFTRKAHRDDD